MNLAAANTNPNEFSDSNRIRSVRDRLRRGNRLDRHRRYATSALRSSRGTQVRLARPVPNSPGLPRGARVAPKCASHARCQTMYDLPAQPLRQFGQQTENYLTDAVFLGGDRYHNAAEAHAGIGPVLEKAGLEVHYTTDFASIDADLLNGVRLLIFLRDGMEWPNGHDADPERWMQPHQEEAIEQFVLNGGSFLVMHNSAWNYPWNGGYRRTVAGYYQFHPPYMHFDVHITDKDHPITDGVEDYEIEDEQHFIWFDKDRVDLFATSQGKDGRESASGYSHEYGKGRVVYLANGHRQVVLEHPSVQKLLTNAVNWLLRS